MAKRANSEGSIYRRKDGRWAASLTLPSGRRRHFYTRTRGEAAAKLRQAQRAAQDGLPLPPARITFGSFATEWLEETARPRLRDRTVEGYRSILTHGLLPAFGKTRLADFTPASVQRYMNAKIAQGLKPQTVRNHHALLRRILGDAERFGLIARNPARLVSAPRVEREPVQPLTTEEAQRLLDALRGDPLEPLFQLALTTGMRSGELLGLTWPAVDLDRGELRVERALQRLHGEFQLVATKTHRSRRHLPIPAETVALLRRQRAAQAEARLRAGAAWGDEWGLVFTTDWGAPVHPWTLRNELNQALARAGLPHIRMHDLRHSAASFMLAAGSPLKVVQEVLGHSTIAVTSGVYAHLEPQMVREATDGVARLLAGDSVR